MLLLTRLKVELDYTARKSRIVLGVFIHNKVGGTRIEFQKRGRGLVS